MMFIKIVAKFSTRKIYDRFVHTKRTHTNTHTNTRSRSAEKAGILQFIYLYFFVVNFPFIGTLRLSGLVSGLWVLDSGFWGCRRCGTLRTYRDAENSWP